HDRSVPCSPGAWPRGCDRSVPCSPGAWPRGWSTPNHPEQLDAPQLSPHVLGPVRYRTVPEPLGGSSTDDDGWRHPRVCARGQWFDSVTGRNRAPRTADPSVTGRYRAPRTAHPRGGRVAGRRCTSYLPGPLARASAIGPAAGRAAEPRASGHDPPAAAAVGAHARAGAGAAVGERLSTKPARRVPGWGVGGWGVV